MLPLTPSNDALKKEQITLQRSKPEGGMEGGRERERDRDSEREGGSVFRESMHVRACQTLVGTCVWCILNDTNFHTYAYLELPSSFPLVHKILSRSGKCSRSNFGKEFLTEN